VNQRRVQHQGVGRFVLEQVLDAACLGADRGQAFQHVHLWRAERKLQNGNLVAAFGIIQGQRHVGDQGFRRQGVAVCQQARHGGVDDRQKHVVDAARLGLGNGLDLGDRQRAEAKFTPGDGLALKDLGHAEDRDCQGALDADGGQRLSGEQLVEAEGGRGRGGGLADRAADEFSQRALRRGLAGRTGGTPSHRARTVLSDADGANQFETTWTNVRPSMMA
jgi:hypothetical protein